MASLFVVNRGISGECVRPIWYPVIDWESRATFAASGFSFFPWRRQLFPSPLFRQIPIQPCARCSRYERISLAGTDGRSAAVPANEIARRRRPLCFRRRRSLQGFVGWSTAFKETHPMAWSKWRAAVVLVLLGSVGLAWSQSPMFNRPASSPSSERIMTVHENGQALRCRVIQSWKTPAGAQAHQLQVLETGAMLTILEDGVPTTVSQGPGSQVRALPMRIFHW